MSSLRSFLLGFHTYLKHKLIHELKYTLRYIKKIQCCIYANLFNAKFDTVEKFTLGHVAAHCAASSGSVYAHAQLSASGRTCTSCLIMRLCQSASQRNSLVVLQLHWRRLPREGACSRIASFWKAPVDNSDSRISLVCHY